jgi:hypothetical protein
MPDAITAVFGPLYQLWEVWASRVSLRATADQDNRVSRDSGGETTAALVCARGGNTHKLIEFGERLGFGTHPFGTSPFGVGGWYWQPFRGPLPKFGTRNGWYGRHVQAQEVSGPLEVARRWLAAQPETRRP